MTTIIDAQPIVGLEHIQRGAFYVLFEGLNDTLDQVALFWSAEDENFATMTDREVVLTELEHIPADSFHEGHKPSLVKSNNPDDFPNCSVMALRATPSPESNLLDQMTSYIDLLFVEVMVKSDKDEQEVNRRIQRTVEAVNICIHQHQTLGGIVAGLETAPTIDISEVFTIPARTSYGQPMFWQGARIEYAVRKQSVNPPSSGSIFRTDPPVYDIDQN